MERELKTLKTGEKTFARVVWRDTDLYLVEVDMETGDQVETVIKDPNILAKEQQGEISAGDIPGWATWTETEALDYIEANVTDLASAKTVLKAMARMVVALRDKTFPRLG